LVLSKRITQSLESYSCQEQNNRLPFTSLNLGQSSEKSAKQVSRFFFCDCPPPDPEVVVKNMLPAFQAPAQFKLPLEVQNSNLAGFMVLGRGIIVANEKSVYKRIEGVQILGRNFNLQVISSSGRKWGRRTSDEKNVSTKSRGAEARRSGGATLGANFSSVRPHVLKISSLIIALRQVQREQKPLRRRITDEA
jgi:hypothetical protein